jgi:PKD repeat protein
MKKLDLLWIAFLLLLIGNATEYDAHASTIYVSPTGSDDNSGTFSQPVATPHRALALAQYGDWIYLRAGRYNVTRMVWIDKDNLTISSYPGESAAIIGSINDSSNLGRVINIAANNISLIGIEIQGGYEYCLKLESNRGTLIRNCRIYGSGRDCVKMFNADNATIEGCEIGPSGLRDPSNAEGIDSVGSRGTLIRECFFHDIATNGLYLKGGAADCVVERNRVERTGGAGILLGQDTDLEFMRDGTQYEAINCIARNNVVVRAEGAGLGTYSGNNIRFENNTLYDVARTFHAGFYVVTNSRDVPSRQVLFKNNIVVVTSTRPMSYIIKLSDSLTCDSNIWYKPSGSYEFRRETATSYDSWSSLAGWQSGMNADYKSLVTDPGLDPAFLFKPLPSSPAIDRGEAVAEVTDDYLGITRPQGRGYDIGAYEYTGTTASPPKQPPQVSITASTRSGVAPLNVNFTANTSNFSVASYAWDFGDGQTSSEPSPSHVYRSAGTFNVHLTVTDNAGATANSSIIITVTTASAGGTGGISAAKVVWTNVLGCTAADNNLTKTASTTWGNAGAVSAQTITSGNGYVEFTVSATIGERIFGLTSSDVVKGYSNLAFAIRTTGPGHGYYVLESGEQVGHWFGECKAGDVFRIAVESGTVRYYRNGSAFNTSSLAPRYPLRAGAAIQGQGASIDNAIIAFASGKAAAPLPQVSVLSPAGHDVYKSGTICNIIWSVSENASSGGSEPSEVSSAITGYDLQVSLDDGETWVDLVKGLPRTATSYQWKVAKPTSSSNARICLVLHTQSGVVGQFISGSFVIKKKGS